MKKHLLGIFKLFTWVLQLIEFFCISFEEGFSYLRWLALGHILSKNIMLLDIFGIALHSVLRVILTPKISKIMETPIFGSRWVVGMILQTQFCANSWLFFKKNYQETTKNQEILQEFSTKSQFSPIKCYCTQKTTVSSRFLSDNFRSKNYKNRCCVSKVMKPRASSANCLTHTDPLFQISSKNLKNPVF